MLATMLVRSLAVPVLLVPLVVLAACGSSDSGSPPASPVSTSNGGASGASGGASTAGTSGASGAPSGGASGAAGHAGASGSAGTGGTSGSAGAAGAAGGAGIAGSGGVGPAGSGGASGTAGGSVAGAAGAAGSASSPGGSGGAAAASGAGGMLGTSEMIDVTKSPCFTLATGTSDANNPCDGDLYFLTGANVDLGAAAAGTPYCIPASGMPAPAASLLDVPTDYSACMWTGYVEGGNGLANTGFIVRDASATHHYRMHVTSNTLPTFVFEYDAID